MGLDSYLYIKKETYKSSGPYRIGAELKDEDIPTGVQVLLGDCGITEPSATFSQQFNVAYWRKANHIHEFFVRECADGVDDCRPVYVNFEHIQDLRNRCNVILVACLTGDKEQLEKVAKENLPTSSGFFFGSEEYDDWYIEQTKYTKDICDKLIEWFAGPHSKEDASSKYSDWDLVYCASW